MEVRRPHLFLTPVDVWRVPLVIFIHLLKDNPFVKRQHYIGKFRAGKNKLLHCPHIELSDQLIVVKELDGSQKASSLPHSSRRVACASRNFHPFAKRQPICKKTTLYRKNLGEDQIKYLVASSTSCHALLVWNCLV